MASQLNFKRELTQAFKRLPAVTVIVSVGLVGTLLLAVVIMTVIVFQFTSNPQAEQANEIMKNGAGRAQAVIGLADCLTGDNCPEGRKPADAADDAAELIADRSTVNGTSFASPHGEELARWGNALMRYGRLEQDSVKRISGSPNSDSETIQVENTQGTAMVCDLTWSKANKLTSWQCYADSPTTPTRGKSR